MKIGSLFDGSGGFPLAASMCGIEPVWASEIEPYPIAVTRSRFPNMKHLGSVTDIRGDEIEPVDVITFGSPCQDLSVAGKRAGLKHTENGDDETTRSGLFMEAVRIIKEMRKATNGEYPRYAIWENVPGAFSSNKGLDFRVVLEELIRIAEPTAVMPEVPKAGWPYADVYCGDGWSLAYRVLDAQHWGVPQRRRRIYLVADFRGQRAGQVSFEREGLSGHSAQSGAPWQGIAGNASGGSGADDREGESAGDRGGRGLDAVGLTNRGFCSGEKAETLRAESHGALPMVCEAVPYTLKIRGGVEVDSAGKAAGKGALIQKNMSATLAAAQDQYLFQPVTLEPGIAAREGGHIYEGVCGTLRANAGDNQMAVAHMVLDDQGGQQITVRNDGKRPTLRAEMHGNVPCVVESAGFKELNSAKARSDGFEHEMSPCLAANKHDACVVYSVENHPADSRVNIDDSGKVQTLTSRMGTGGGNVPMVMEPTYAIEGNGSRPSHQGDGYSESDTMYTLNTIERHAVAYWDGGQTCGTLTANNAGGNQRMPDKENFNCVIALDRAFYNQGQNAQYDPQFYTDGTVPTLVAKGPGAVAVRYIVRRLTPTECARLQGFPDAWGHPDIKESLTDEEYAFWLNVRNTHAAINGKATKEYTRDQMLTWYNKLHTDSSEYKLWGNGIALPCALYVMQGIAEVSNEN